MNEKAQEKYDDPEFAKLLEEGESYYEEAQSFYEWAPDDGENTCSIVAVKVDKTTDKKLKKEVARVRVTVAIRGGDDDGETFDMSGPFGWTLRNFNGLKTLASLLAGKPVMTLPAALDVLYDHEDAWIMVKTSRTPRKEGDGVWVNHQPIRLLEIGGEGDDGGEDVEAPAE